MWIVIIYTQKPFGVLNNFESMEGLETKKFENHFLNVAVFTL